MVVQEYKVNTTTGEFITRTVPTKGSDNGGNTGVVETDGLKVAFNKYVVDSLASVEGVDSTLAGRVDDLEETVDTETTGLVARVGVIEGQINTETTGILARLTALEAA